MAQSSTRGIPLPPFPAYRLANAPAFLNLDPGWRWEMAELEEEPVPDREAADEEAGWPEEDSPFPVELARYLREIQDAGDLLADSLPRTSGSRLSEDLADALGKAWCAFEGAWLSP